MNLVNSGLVKAMRLMLETHELSSPNWLAAAGLPPNWFDQLEHAKYVPLADFIALGDRLPQTVGGRPTGVMLAISSIPNTYGSVSFLASACRTVADAAEQIFEFEKLVISNAITTVHQGPDVCIQWQLADASVPVWLEEWIVSAWLHLARWSAGNKIIPLEVGFTHEQTLPVGGYVDFFGCVPKFSCDRCAMKISRDVWRLPLHQPQPHLIAPLQYLLNKEKMELGTNFLADVESWLRTQLFRPATSLPTVSELSGYLSMSERSLRRRLEEEGTCFSELMRKLRMERAENLLKDSEFNISTISATVGYRDVVSFRRAFKRWSGCSPSDYRKR